MLARQLFARGMARSDRITCNICIFIILIATSQCGGTCGLSPVTASATRIQTARTKAVPHVQGGTRSAKVDRKGIPVEGVSKKRRRESCTSQDDCKNRNCINLGLTSTWPGQWEVCIERQVRLGLGLRQSKLAVLPRRANFDLMRKVYPEERKW